MQILNIKAENFKGLKLVEVVPEKVTTVIGGKNRAGKSSLLDAVAATLGGVKMCPKQPIREGQDKATCEVKLEGDESRLLPPCLVTRTWERRENGSIASQLEIVTADGYKAPSPQTILNDVVGPLGFDPERFLRMKPKEQAEVLRGLVGLDFTELDAEREKAFSRRTEVNRDGKKLKARFDAMPRYEDAPKEEISVATLMEELKRRQAVNRHNKDVRDELAELQDGLTLCDQEIASAELDVKEFEKRLKQSRKRLEVRKKKKAKTTGYSNVTSVAVTELKDEDEEEIQGQVTASEETNRKVRENGQRDTLEKDLGAEREKSADLTEKIDQIDSQKQKMRQDAKWPVKGLGYDESGVTLLTRPFEQASATEQRQAAFGIVAALNPALKFAMIKDGSLLDDESLQDFGRIATEKGFQLFVERVGEGQECTVIISDGEVKDSAQ